MNRWPFEAWLCNSEYLIYNLPFVICNTGILSTDVFERLLEVANYIICVKILGTVSRTQ